MRANERPNRWSSLGLIVHWLLHGLKGAIGRGDVSWHLVIELTRRQVNQIPRHGLPCLPAGGPLGRLPAASLRLHALAPLPTIDSSRAESALPAGRLGHARDASF